MYFSYLFCSYLSQLWPFVRRSSFCLLAYTYLPLCICLFIYLSTVSVCLSIYQPLCICLYLSTCIYLQYLSVYSIYLSVSVCLLAYLSALMSVYLSVYSIYLSVSVCLSVCLPRPGKSVQCSSDPEFAFSIVPQKCINIMENLNVHYACIIPRE